MIFRRLGLINRNQMGFTLIEILLVMAISGIITGGITMTIFQVVEGSARTNNHMIAVRQVQNAGYWVSHDAQMAQSVELEWPEEHPVGSKFPLLLTWTDWDGVNHQVTYTLEQGGQPKQLKRSHSINGGEPSQTIVAQYIVPGLTKTNLDFTNGALVFMVTANVGDDSQEQSETRVYEIVPRPGL